MLRLTSPFDPRLIPLEGRENSQGAFTGRKAWNSTGISYIPPFPVIYIYFLLFHSRPATRIPFGGIPWEMAESARKVRDGRENLGKVAKLFRGRRFACLLGRVIRRFHVE